MKTSQKLFKQVSKIVELAGKQLIQKFGQIKKVKPKKGTEITIREDLQIEKFLIKELNAISPSASIWSEEAGGTIRKGKPAFIIDPIDGTSNFAAGIPIFGIMVAYFDGQEVTFGLSYAPLFNEMCIAARGSGTRINGKLVRVNENSDLAKSLINITRGTAREDFEWYSQAISRIGKVIRTTRYFGDMANVCKWVASGRIDGLVIQNTKPSDMAAASIIIEEAGGKATNFQGKRWCYKDADLVATNGRIHDALLAGLRKVK